MESSLWQQFLAPFYSDTFVGTFSFLKLILPFWLPIFLGILFWHFWLKYRNQKFIAEQEYILLEILLPVEITKSPLAMESVLSGLHFGPGLSTWLKKYVIGSVPPWWSLELVSDGGEIHFYIWTRKNLKNIVESQFYAQYPSIEIHEVEDYTKKIHFEPKKLSVWGCDFVLKKPDAYPIKTYVDYGLDKDPKEEFKVDPMAPVLEFLGSIKKGEHVWYQIIIRQDKKGDRKKPKSYFGKIGWQEAAMNEMEKIKKESIEKTQESTGSSFTFFSPTPIEKDQLEAIARSITKPGFQCGIRGIYFAHPETFDPTNIAPFLNSFKQFSSNTLNGFDPARWLFPFDYPWQDIGDMRQNRERRRLFDAYRRRSWFYPPYKTNVYVLNTEELATIFHFPGATIKTPNLARITSKRGDAPANLPK